jgi:hypothetical protein
MRRVTRQRVSFSDPLVWSGFSGRSSSISNSALLACNHANEAIQRHEAIAAEENTVAAGL